MLASDGDPGDNIACRDGEPRGLSLPRRLEGTGGHTHVADGSTVVS